MHAVQSRGEEVRANLYCRLVGSTWWEGLSVYARQDKMDNEERRNTNNLGQAVYLNSVPILGAEVPVAEPGVCRDSPYACSF